MRESSCIGAAAADSNTVLQRSPHSSMRESVAECLHEGRWPPLQRSPHSSMRESWVIRKWVRQSNKGLQRSPHSSMRESSCIGAAAADSNTVLQRSPHSSMRESVAECLHEGRWPPLQRSPHSSMRERPIPIRDRDRVIISSTEPSFFNEGKLW